MTADTKDAQIASLREQVESLTRERDEALAREAELHSESSDEISDWEQAFNQMKARAESAEARASTLETAARETKEALEPFAEFPIFGGHEEKDAYQLTGRIGSDGKFRVITTGDLRRAHTALSRLSSILEEKA